MKNTSLIMMMAALLLAAASQPALAAPEVGKSCSNLGETKMSSTKDAVIGCFNVSEVENDNCSAGCEWKLMTVTSAVPDGVSCGAASGTVGANSTSVTPGTAASAFSKFNLDTPTVSTVCRDKLFVKVANSGPTHLFYDACPTGYSLVVKMTAPATGGVFAPGAYTAQCMSGKDSSVTITGSVGDHIYRIIKQ